MTHRLYKIEAPLPPETTADGVRMGLGYADQPVEFSVVTEDDPHQASLTIRLIYPADTQEETKRIEHGRVYVLVGRYSKRLFEVRVDFRELFSSHDPKEVTAQIAKDLQGAFQELNKAEKPGTRLNYRAAQVGLKLNSAVPPAWLIDAMSAEITRSTV